MKLNDYFKRFIGKISLNPTREDRINSALQNWESIFINDDEISSMFLDFYTQGSYSTSTAIKPKENDEYDVDVVLLLDADDEYDARELLTFVYDRMKTKEQFKDKLKKKDRCIRVDYAGDFHVDIVPAKPTDDEHILISSKNENEWIETNPAGFTSWVKERHSDNNYKLVNLVKLTKFWRDNKVGADTAPKSILLTALLGDFIESKTSDAETFVCSIEAIADGLDEILVDGEPFYENPSLEGENLARDWNREKYDIFIRKITSLSEKARKALEEEDKEKSIDLWIDVFGDKFPKELSEAINFAERVSKNEVKVTQSGRLNEHHGVGVPKQRFYGYAE